MHEMGIVHNILEILEHQAALYKARRIVRVNLEFGFLTAVMPEAVTFAFGILAKGGIAEDAEVDVKIIPLKTSCADCGDEHVTERYEPLCPTCSSPGIRILEGRDEMRIASFEIED